jgi:release factor glutamine methyltransferase
VTVRDALARAAADLRDRGVESPDNDAELLLAHVLGASRAELALERPRRLTAGEREAFDALVERRGRREPLAYVLGEWDFRGLTLRTDRRALVPRPETEMLVERCLELLAPLPAPRVLDVGTGSGAIALAIADEHPGASVVALDSSSDALELALENLRETGLGDRVRMLEWDLAGGLPAGPYDLVVANPPYVAADEIATLVPEVRDWEPRGAIVDAGQGEAVARSALPVLSPGGSLVLETHGNGARPVADLLLKLGFAGVTISRDLAGRQRIVEGRRRREVRS